MRNNKKGALLGVLIAFLTLSCCQTPSEKKAQQYILNSTLIPGLGNETFHVGQTQLAEVEQLLGPAPEKKTSEGTKAHCTNGNCTQTEFQTLSLIYPKTGLLFEFEKELAKPAILQRFSVSCKTKVCPFQGQTQEGVRLQDTRETLYKAHGKPPRKPHNNWVVIYREGIGFGFEHHPGSMSNPEDIIDSIQILSKDHPNLR